VYKHSRLSGLSSPISFGPIPPLGLSHNDGYGALHGNFAEEQSLKLRKGLGDRDCDYKTATDELTFLCRHDSVPNFCRNKGNGTFERIRPELPGGVDADG